MTYKLYVILKAFLLGIILFCLLGCKNQNDNFTFDKSSNGEYILYDVQKNILVRIGGLERNQKINIYDSVGEINLRLDCKDGGLKIFSFTDDFSKYYEIVEFCDKDSEDNLLLSRTEWFENLFITKMEKIYSDGRIETNLLTKHPKEIFRLKPGVSFEDVKREFGEPFKIDSSMLIVEYFIVGQRKAILNFGYNNTLLWLAEANVNGEIKKVYFDNIQK